MDIKPFGSSINLYIFEYYYGDESIESEFDSFSEENGIDDNNENVNENKSSNITLAELCSVSSCCKTMTFWKRMSNVHISVKEKRHLQNFVWTGDYYQVNMIRMHWYCCVMTRLGNKKMSTSTLGCSSTTWNYLMLQIPVWL